MRQIVGWIGLASWIFLGSLGGAVAAPAEGGFCAPVTSSSVPHVQWAKLTFRQALQRAKKLHCPLLVDLYATWCGPCKRYDRKVFTQNIVANYIHEHFVPLRRDGLRGEGKMLTQRFNCVTYPCILVIDENGHEVERITRFMGPRRFLGRLTQIRKGQAILASLLPQLKQRPKDAVLRFRIGYRLAYRGDARCVEHLLFVAAHPPKRFPWLAARALYVLGRIYYRNTKRDCAAALRIFRRYLREHPRGRKVRRVRGMIRWCLRRMR